MFDYLMVMALVAVAGLVIALLMILRDRLLARRRERAIEQITANVIDGYVPAVNQAVVNSTMEIMYELVRKVPGWMGEIKKTIEEMNKIE
jgi:hypothetical protein